LNTDAPLWSQWKAKVESELAAQGQATTVDKLFTKLADGTSIAPLYPDPSPFESPLPSARAGEPELVSWPVAAAAGDIDLRHIEQDGASPTEELASALIAALAAPGNAVIHLGVSPDILIQIAKLRAIRRLLGRLSELDGHARAPILHAHTSLRSFTRHDPWVNLLRNSAAVFAAMLGGADRITPAPYDIALGEPSDEAKRLADHTVRIAQHESSLGFDADPTAGSHAIEHLTEALCKDAWSLAATPDAIAPRIAATKATRATRLARRQDNLIGTTLYPELDELVPARPLADCSPRLALPFERLRAAGVAAHACVFLATFGPLARHTARSSWVAQLVAAGGIRPIDTTPPGADGFASIDAVADAFTASRTTVAIVCVADADWGEAAATLMALASALRARGATVLVAGRQSPALAALSAPDLTDHTHLTDHTDLIAGYIHAGLPALDVLTDLHVRLGTGGLS